jgi:hypothetical protein
MKVPEGKYRYRPGVLNLLCALGPFDKNLVKSTDSISEKSIKMPKICIVRFIELKKKTFLESTGHKTLCRLHSLLNEKANFS